MAVTETMAELLEIIDEAEYGRDVRDAIHKGVQKCYEDGSAGSEDEVARDAVTALQASLWQIIYPVGSIYMSADSTNPGSIFGGTWVAWGSGRVPVGVDTNDTDFNTVEKTGGAKTVTLTSSNMPAHTHTYNKANTPTGSTAITTAQMPSHTHTYSNKTLTTTKAGFTKVSSGGGSAFTSITAGNANTAATGSGSGHTHTISSSSAASGSAGSGTAVSKLQPYITCYMFKRTA